jgi:hypothetical protein
MSAPYPAPNHTTVDAFTVLADSPSSLDVAVRGLLGQLMLETHRANQFLHEGKVVELNALLQMRDELLTKLEGATQVMQRAQNKPDARVLSGPSQRADHVNMTTNLQRANAQLMRGAQREAVRLTAAIAAVGKPDMVGAAYRTTTKEQTSCLNLTR